LFRPYGRKEGRTEGQADMTKLKVTFRNFAKVPKRKFLTTNANICFNKRQWTSTIECIIKAEQYVWSEVLHEEFILVCYKNEVNIRSHFNLTERRNERPL